MSHLPSSSAAAYAAYPEVEGWIEEPGTSPARVNLILKNTPVFHRHFQPAQSVILSYRICIPASFILETVNEQDMLLYARAWDSSNKSQAALPAGWLGGQRSCSSC